MNEDLKKAYELAKGEEEHNTPVTSAFLQTLNAALMRFITSWAVLSIPQKVSTAYVALRLVSVDILT